MQKRHLTNFSFEFTAWELTFQPKSRLHFWVNNSTLKLWFTAAIFGWKWRFYIFHGQIWSAQKQSKLQFLIEYPRYFDKLATRECTFWMHQTKQSRNSALLPTSILRNPLIIGFDKCIQVFSKINFGFKRQ